MHFVNILLRALRLITPVHSVLNGLHNMLKPAARAILAIALLKLPAWAAHVVVAVAQQSEASVRLEKLIVKSALHDCSCSRNTDIY